MMRALDDHKLLYMRNLFVCEIEHNKQPNTKPQKHINTVCPIHCRSYDTSYNSYTSTCTHTPTLSLPSLFASPSATIRDPIHTSALASRAERPACRDIHTAGSSNEERCFPHSAHCDQMNRTKASRNTEASSPAVHAEQNIQVFG